MRLDDLLLDLEFACVDPGISVGIDIRVRSTVDGPYTEEIVLLGTVCYLRCRVISCLWIVH